MKNFTLLFLLLFLPATVSAHSESQGYDFMAGLAHPFAGSDHMSMMLGVGVVAVVLGGRVMWQLPLGFMFAMLVGAGLATLGVTLGLVEVMIAASVLTMGVMLLFADKLALTTKLVTALVMVFAIFHGYAHASEMPISSSISLYFVGFIVSTLLLHLLGLASCNFLIAFKLDKLVFKVVGSMLTIFGGVLLVF